MAGAQAANASLTTTGRPPDREQDDGGGSTAGNGSVDTSQPFDLAIRRILRAIRVDLGLEVAFISELRDGVRVFRYVDADARDRIVQVGASDPVEESYCHYVVNGAIPEFVRDPARHGVARRLAATAAVPVGTHLSVPILFSDGSVYGTFCCFSTEVKDHLDEASLGGIRVMARVLAEYLEEHVRTEQVRDARRAALVAVRIGTDLALVFQPIVDLASGTTIGVEALARFPTLAGGPAAVFADAWSLGVGLDLELKAARAAVGELPRLPGGLYLSVNASPALVACVDFHAVLARYPAPKRLVVEVTEHAVVRDYDELLQAVARLGDLGIRLAIDDVGMGFSGLNHILRVEPHILKLDAGLVRDIDVVTTKQALASALVDFAGRTGASVVAEGIETAAELEVVRGLGVGFGQGYHLGRPAPLPPAAE